MIVELLGAMDGARPPRRGFYDRLCDASAGSPPMDRAGLLLYDDARQLVVPWAATAWSRGCSRNIYGTLEETPIAQVALSEDRVVEATGELERWVPERYARSPA